MLKLAEADVGALRWTRSGDAHSYQLASDTTPVATLHWTKAYGTLATAETADARWTLKRAGFLKPLVTVRDSTNGRDLAALHVHLHSSLVQLPGGSTYRWARMGFWIPAWEFQSAAGAGLVNFEPVRKGTRLEGGLITVSREGQTCPDLLLLLVLGWYYVVQSWIEDEATAASGAALAGATVATMG